MTSPSQSAPGVCPWRIIFMGTPEFAVPCLQALIDGPDEVVAVVAQPDRPSGRGNKLQSPPTIQLARAHQIPTLQAEKVRVPAFRDALAAFQPDLMVVVAYGRILTEAVLNVPLHGCINVHASLLPKYRGAAPIQWSVLRGEHETGVTTMKMDVGLDTGDMLLKRTLELGPELTAGALHDLLAPVGAALLLETVAQLKQGLLHPTPQDHAAATLAPMLKKEDGLIDWRRPARELDWHVRGMTPWPSAYTFLEKGARLTVLKGRPLSDTSALEPGQVVSAQADGLVVATGEGLYRIEMLKPENGKAMLAGAWLNGHPVPVGARLGA
ncbi:MAG: methionyl-tRNA formyltransferase [Myxococcota bacterium]